MKFQVLSNLYLTTLLTMKLLLTTLCLSVCSNSNVFLYAYPITQTVLVLRLYIWNLLFWHKACRSSSILEQDCKFHFFHETRLCLYIWFFVCLLTHKKTNNDLFIIGFIPVNSKIDNTSIFPPQSQPFQYPMSERGINRVQKR